VRRKDRPTGCSAARQAVRSAPRGGGRFLQTAICHQFSQTEGEGHNARGKGLKIRLGEWSLGKCSSSICFGGAAQDGCGQFSGKIHAGCADSDSCQENAKPSVVARADHRQTPAGDCRRISAHGRALFTHKHRPIVSMLRVAVAQQFRRSGRREFSAPQRRRSWRSDPSHLPVTSPGHYGQS